MVIEPGRKLRALFRRGIRAGYLTNGVLDPAPEAWIAAVLEAGECLVVRVETSGGRHYWLSDRRVLMEPDGQVFRYDSVRQVHWMFRDFSARMKTSIEAGDGAWPSRMKTQYGDRLEVELDAGEFMVMDGLAGAFQAVFSFLRFLSWRRSKGALGAM